MIEGYSPTLAPLQSWRVKFQSAQSRLTKKQVDVKKNVYVYGPPIESALEAVRKLPI